MSSKTISGYYGKSKNPCEILVVGDWYCVSGSVNANRASFDEFLVDGVNVEELIDYDTFTSPEPITDIEQFESLISE